MQCAILYRLRELLRIPNQLVQKQPLPEKLPFCGLNFNMPRNSFTPSRL